MMMLGWHTPSSCVGWVLAGLGHGAAITRGRVDIADITSYGVACIIIAMAGQDVAGARRRKKGTCSSSSRKGGHGWHDKSARPSVLSGRPGINESASYPYKFKKDASLLLPGELGRCFFLFASGAAL